MKQFFGTGIGIAIGLMNALAQGPVYTTAQAAQGKTIFVQHCASCHGAALDDGEFAPPLRGAGFTQQWGGKTVEALFTYSRSRMPPSSPGSLGAEAYAQIVAYVLEANSVNAGVRDLPSDVTVLRTMTIPGGGGPQGPGGGLSPFATLPAAPKTTNPLDKLTLVTDAMLANPAAGDWLTWRRTYDGQGFSTLRQITKANIANLRVAWSWALPNGPNEATPIVHDGVIFVHAFGDRVQALDAATGDLLWQYARQLPKDIPASVKRGISIYGDKLITLTSDAHVVALHTKTGKVIWDKEVADYKSGMRLTGGPLVAKGKVMLGTVGRAEGGNFILALDAETGKEAWRFHTLAQTGEPGGNTWNNLPANKRNGGSVWVPGSYDAALNLAYFGVAQTYDTGPLMKPIGMPGVTNDGLYTDTTVAINPDTGKLVWHFQHLPNDQWDLDWAFERTLLSLPVNGANAKLILTGGKQAVYDAVDAATGKYAFSMDLGLQNVFLGIDAATGEKHINPKVVPGDGETKLVCPHAGGAKSWLPASYNPITKMLYVPLVESCMDLIPVGPDARGSLSSGVRWVLRPPIDSDGKYGRMQAIHLATRKVAWTERQRAPQSTGALATAGGVVFSGSLDRWFRAQDDTTGKTLWQMRLNDVPSNSPISYEVNGRQYVAVVVGNGGAQAATFPVLVPEIKNPPEHGAAIWVFELPQRGLGK